MVRWVLFGIFGVVSIGGAGVNGELGRRGVVGIVWGAFYFIDGLFFLFGVGSVGRCLASGTFLPVSLQWGTLSG